MAKEKNNVGVKERTTTTTKKLKKTERMYAVYLHNDDHTPFEYVILMLTKYFEKSVNEGFELALHVHKSGKGMAGIYDLTTAYEKVNAVEKENKLCGFNLIMTVEEI